MKLDFEQFARCLAVVAVVAVATIGFAAAAESEAPEAAPTPQTEQAALQSGKVVHIDPQTGRKIALPSEAQKAAARAHLQAMANRSSAGLFETASPRSGVMVNLQGRLRLATVVTVDAEGQATAQCTTRLPAAPAGDAEEARSE